jgi:hypothetical protein
MSEAMNLTNFLVRIFYPEPLDISKYVIPGPQRKAQPAAKAKAPEKPAVHTVAPGYEFADADELDDQGAVHPTWDRYYGDGTRVQHLTALDREELAGRGLDEAKAALLKSHFYVGRSAAGASAEIKDDKGRPRRGFSESSIDPYWSAFYAALEREQSLSQRLARH